ncbi:hypothetical protein EMIT0P43_70015 [Pseudomonas jessenii]
MEIEPMPVFRSPSQWADAFLTIAMPVTSRLARNVAPSWFSLARVVRIDSGAKFITSDQSAFFAGFFTGLLKLGYMPTLHEYAFGFGRFAFARTNLRPQLEKQVYETTVRYQVLDPRSGARSRERQRGPIAAQLAGPGAACREVRLQPLLGG